MTEFAATPTNSSKTTTWTRAMVLRALWSGWAASVPVVLLAMIAVEAVPHARGIGFFPQLRFAIITPACVLVAIAAAFLYRALAESSGRPRSALLAALLGLAVIVLLGMTAAGPSGLTAAAFPAVLSVAVAVALLVPRFVDRPRRSRAGTVAIVVFGILELTGVAFALSSERIAPPDPQGLAFEIPRAMFDADHKFVDLPSGARVHYVDEGSGETLLFLHGNPSWSFQWRDLIRGLRGSYRCIALDYPGFGLSEAPAGFGFTPREQSLVLEEFVDRLGLRDVTLVMQDWGGPIGLGLAGRRPELVRRVVLGSTWAWQTSTGVPRGKFSVVAGGPVGEFVQMNFNGFASLAINHGIVHKLPSDVADVYERPFRPLDRRGIAAFYPGQITAATAYFAEVEAGLPRVAEKEALIFWALLDAGFPRGDLERFEKTFPNHKTIELPDANHFFFEDEANKMIQEIRAFVSSDAAGPSAETRPGASMVQTRPPFDASRMRTGHFLYRTVHRGKDAGTSNISVVRLDERTYRFRNEVTGAFRQTWESTATSSFEPLSATLGLGERDEKSTSMKLTYDGQAVAGTATKIDPVEGRRTNAVSAHIPFDTVDQRIDWAAMVASPLIPGQQLSFSVYDPWTGVSPVSARIFDAEHVRVPAGEFDAYRVIYRIEKSRHVEQYEIWVSTESPHFLVREAFPNGAVTELTQLTPSVRNTAR